MSGSFLDATCVGRLVAVFWPSHVRWYEGEVRRRRRRRNRSNLKRKLSFLSAAETHHRLEPAAIKASLGRRESIRINELINSAAGSSLLACTGDGVQQKVAAAPRALHRRPSGVVELGGVRAVSLR
jgi:hypothetical protein